MRTLAIIPAYNEAGSVGDVVRAIHREQPDVLVLDIMLGHGESGLDLCRALKAAAATRSIRTARRWSRKSRPCCVPIHG